MNKLITWLLGAALLTATGACKKEIDVVDPDRPDVGIPEQPTERPGKVCPVGTSLDQAITSTIGPAGGQLTSADERLTITVPAGAVETAQTFSIQPITSTGPQALGNAFRLAPHGITFKKPVTLTVRYEPGELDGTAAEVLALAYQNSNGIWTLAANGNVNTDARTVSVTTTHFSDWAVLARVFLSPNIGFVKQGRSLGLEVRMLTDDIDTPVVSELPVPEPYEATARFIVQSSWKVNGGGSVNPAGSKATYKAPAVVPARNPVAVTVQLKGAAVIEGKPYREIQLVSNIFIGDVGITYRINGGKWVQTIPTLQGTQIFSTSEGLLFSMDSGGMDGDNQVGVSIKKKNPPQPGNYSATGGIQIPWSTDASGGMFLLSDFQSGVMYVQYYQVGRTAVPSPGALIFEQFGQSGDYVTGRFELTKAGILHPTKGFIGTVKIEGFFRDVRIK